MIAGVYQRLLGRTVCRRRGHDIQQRPSPPGDTILILACRRCGRIERYPLRRLNRAERRAAARRP